MGNDNIDKDNSTESILTFANYVAERLRKFSFRKFSGAHFTFDALQRFKTFQSVRWFDAKVNGADNVLVLNVAGIASLWHFGCFGNDLDVPHGAEAVVAFLVELRYFLDIFRDGCTKTTIGFCRNQVQADSTRRNGYWCLKFANALHGSGC